MKKTPLDRFPRAISCSACTSPLTHPVSVGPTRPSPVLSALPSASLILSLCAPCPRRTSNTSQQTAAAAEAALRTSLVTSLDSLHLCSLHQPPRPSIGSRKPAICPHRLFGLLTSPRLVSSVLLTNSIPLASSPPASLLAHLRILDLSSAFLDFLHPPARLLLVRLQRPPDSIAGLRYVSTHTFRRASNLSRVDSTIVSDRHRLHHPRSSDKPRTASIQKHSLSLNSIQGA